ncbi:MAG: hypothetical protein IBX68_00945 [Dehalococcoidia bacterium]|nr:hypothetical protein [Dehalococcoidia bacterium]
MWIEFRTVPNLVLAEMWKELFEGEGIPTRVLPDQRGAGIRGKYRVLVPQLKKHLVDEVLRKV